MSNTCIIELRDINTIQPYDRNPRINDNAIDPVAASLQEFGFRQPIVVDANGIIIVGHAWHKAALKLGLQKIPVHIATDLTPEQVRAYRIADNKTGELSEWDMEILPIEITELYGTDCLTAVCLSTARGEEPFGTRIAADRFTPALPASNEMSIV